MNYDPVKFCWTCQLSKPRENFRVVPGAPRKREVCSTCYDAIIAARLKIQQEAMKKDTVPF